VAVEWSNERLAEQFRLEVRRAFEAENAKHRAEEAAETEQLKRARGNEYEAFLKQHPHYIDVQDSGFWRTYVASDIQIDRNSVKVVLPRGVSISPDFIEMFDGTSVAWSYAGVNAEIVNGEAHVVIKLILIDYWDDDRAAKWTAEHARARLIRYVHTEPHVEAPWTEDQVASLNAYQASGVMHPFTGERQANGDETVLIATRGGWIENLDGPVVQIWTHPFMADWSWRK
jgi:hypothetical protein